MSRTTRQIAHEWRRYLQRYPEDYDVRYSRHNGYDGKPCSPLYDGTAGDREPEYGPRSRRWYKKRYRRFLRNEGKRLLRAELHDYYGEGQLPLPLIYQTGDRTWALNRHKS